MPEDKSNSLPIEAPSEVEVLSKLDRALGVWIDYSAAGMEVPDDVHARLAEDGKTVAFGGEFSSWATLVRVPVPAPLRALGKFAIRAVLNLTKGAVVVGVADITCKEFLQQKKVEGVGLVLAEVEVDCKTLPGWVVFRHGSVDPGDSVFELRSLQFQLRPHQDKITLNSAPRRVSNPLFGKFPRWSGMVETGFDANWLGIVTRSEFLPAAPESDNDRPKEKMRLFSPALPPLNEEYLEWVSILESVLAARNQFTMIELGAGYGRWLVCAYGALCAANPRLKSLFVGVEAEPQHFEWMKQHFSDNDLDPGKHQLIEAAVTAEDGVVSFAVGHPREWYGQAIVDSTELNLQRYPAAQSRQVKAVSLATIFRDIPHQIPYVDLIDMDIQGAEAQVIGNAEDVLSNRVKRVHIGTHSRTIEEELRKILTKLGWRCAEDHPCFSVSMTRFGAASFNDGVQVWLNPKFD